MTQRWGPAERAQYLTGLDRTAVHGTADVFTDVAEAERLAAACESDWDQAVDALRAARADAGPDADLAHSRHLTPPARARLAEVYRKQQTERLAADAYERARAGLNRALADLEALSRPDLGLPPGPALDAWEFVDAPPVHGRAAA